MVKSFGAERKISLRRMKNRLAQKKRCPEEGLFQPPCRGGAFQPETSPIHLSGLKRLITNVLLGFLKDVSEEKDSYKKQREELCGRIYKYTDGNNSKRIAEFMKL